MLLYHTQIEGLSGGVLDLRSRGGWFETHQRRCVVSLSKARYPLLSTGPEVINFFSAQS